MNRHLQYVISEDGRPQVVRVGNITSATLTLNTGGPHNYTLDPKATHIQ